jgi:SAM-dependent methyltransferase
MSAHPIGGEPSAARASYDELAEEYYDPLAHPTCRNLNSLSRRLIEAWLPQRGDDLDILEVGAGSSTVAPVLHARGEPLLRLALHDRSDAMLAHSARWREFGASLVVSDARKLRRDDASVDLLVAGLGDPYNVPAFWNEAARVSRVGAVVLFTMPSFEWAARFRRDRPAHERHAAEFKLRDGRLVEVPSFVPPLHEQVRLIERAGWMLTRLEALGTDALAPGEAVSPKVDVFGASASSLVWGLRAVRRPERV